MAEQGGCAAPSGILQDSKEASEEKAKTAEGFQEIPTRKGAQV